MGESEAEVERERAVREGQSSGSERVSERQRGGGEEHVVGKFGHISLCWIVATVIGDYRAV